MALIDVLTSVLGLGGFVGAGELPPANWPAEPVVFGFIDGAAPSLAIGTGTCGDGLVVLVVVAAAIEGLFGRLPVREARHVSSALRALVRAIQGREAAGDAGDTLRLANSNDLLCAVFDHFERAVLVATDPEGTLSAGDVG